MFPCGHRKERQTQALAPLQHVHGERPVTETLPCRSVQETNLKCGCGRAEKETGPEAALQDDAESHLPRTGDSPPVVLTTLLPRDPQHLSPASTMRSPQHRDTIVDIQDSGVSPAHPHGCLPTPPPRVPLPYPHPQPALSGVSCGLTDHRTVASGRKLSGLNQQEQKELHPARCLQHVPSSG